MAVRPPDLRAFVQELRRRRVLRAGALYVVFALATVEAADLLFPRLGLADWTVQLVLGLVLVGFPIVLGLAWAFEWTPEGVKSDAGPARAVAEPTVTSAARSSPVPGASAELPRLLVLPFQNVSADRENEYFADGLTDEIITDLSRIRSLGVISRTSAMRLKGGTKDVQTIGRDLGVRYVLEGSVRKSGDQVRISAQLIDAQIDQHLWGETYDGTISEVFRIQEQVASAIATVLSIRLSPIETRTADRRTIDDPVAHESYLRARHEMWSFSKPGLERALRHVQNALAIVGDNELLLAALGHIHVWFLQAGIDADPSHLEEADRCVDAIFRLSPASRHGHRLCAFVDFQRGKLRSVRPHLELSLETNPDDPDALALLGYLYCLTGREDTALLIFERLLAIDPLTPLNHAMPGFAAALQGRFADAVAPYGTFLRMDDGPFSKMNWIWVLGLNGRIEEAAPVLDALVKEHPDGPYAATARSLYHGLRGERAEALAAITPALWEAARQTEMFSRFLAEALALAGERDAALDALERAVDIGLANYPFLARIDPLLSSIRREPRFAGILKRVEAEWRMFQNSAS